MSRLPRSSDPSAPLELGGPDRPRGGPALSQRVEALRLPPEVAARGPRVAWFLILLALLLLGGGGLLAFRVWDQQTRAAAAPATPIAPSAKTPSPAPQSSSLATGDLVLESKGYIIPRRQILISPKVNGMMLRLNVQEGSRVTKGDVLAVLEDIDYRADRDRAAATLENAQRRLEELENGFRPDEINQARAELAEAEALLKQYTSEYERDRKLYQSNAIAPLDFEATEARYHTTTRRVERLRFALKLMEEGPRRERIDAARAEVGQARAELSKAQWRLDNCTIRAPISGTILKKNAEEGNIVNPIAMNGSFSLCEMADLSDLEVDMSIQERDIGRIFVDQKCKVRAEAFPDRTYDGVVSRLMPIADRAKGAISVRVKLTIPKEEEGVYLKPEMGAIVSFYGKPAAEPKTASPPTAAPEAGAANPGPAPTAQKSSDHG